MHFETEQGVSFFPPVLSFIRSPLRIKVILNTINSARGAFTAGSRLLLQIRVALLDARSCSGSLSNASRCKALANTAFAKFAVSFNV